MRKQKKDRDRYDQRFAGVLGDYYDLRSRAMWYHEQFQDKIKDTLATYAKEHQEEEEIKVLEVGGGTGLTSIRILDADSRIKLVTVDSDKKIMEKAKKVLADMSNRIKFVHQDILTFLQSMGDESIDAMASALTIHNFTTSYRNEFLREVARVLKSGGLFVNADKYAPDDPEAYAKSFKEEIDSFDIFETMEVPGLDVKALKQGWVKHYEDDEKTKITESEQINY